MSQDGCPGCCSFSCRLTPTPTPEFDGQGRPVYTTAGRFLLIIEAQLGQSLLNGGTEGLLDDDNNVTAIRHPSDRPSLQVVGSGDFGNGSATICDGSPFMPPGGVPGFDPPWIDCDPDLPAEDLALCQSRQPAVRDALEDIACRFTYVLSEPRACTMDETGDFAFIGQFSSIQYCFQIPLDSELPVGDTILAAQVRDVGGNLGPLKEIVVRVPAQP